MPFYLDPDLNGRRMGSPPAPAPVPAFSHAAGRASTAPLRSAPSGPVFKAADHHYTDEEMACLKEHGYAIDGDGNAVPADGSEDTPAHAAAVVTRTGKPRPPGPDGQRDRGHYGDGNPPKAGKTRPDPADAAPTRKAATAGPGPLAAALAGRVGGVAELDLTGMSATHAAELFDRPGLGPAQGRQATTPPPQPRPWNPPRPA